MSGRRPPSLRVARPFGVGRPSNFDELGDSRRSVRRDRKARRPTPGFCFRARPVRLPLFARAVRYWGPISWFPWGTGSIPTYPSRRFAGRPGPIRVELLLFDEGGFERSAASSAGQPGRHPLAVRNSGADEPDRHR